MLSSDSALVIILFIEDMYLVVMDDLLYAFMGLDGKYARAKRVDQADGAHIIFALEARADPSLQELATRMLPIWYVQKK